MRRTDLWCQVQELGVFCLSVRVHGSKGLNQDIFICVLNIRFVRCGTVVWFLT